MRNNEKLEQEIQEKGLTAPRVTLDHLKRQIKQIEYHTIKTNDGSLFMYCYLTMKNGFVATGEPSVCVSVSNFNEEIGRKISYENAFNKLWSLEAYLLKTKLSEGNYHA